MVKKIFIFVAFLILTAFQKNGNSVYICGPQGAKKYHYSSSCRGLSACKHQIIEVSKNQAESFGLTLCGWED